MTENKNSINQKWYASWFDTPFYHILYKDRDYQEAQYFMDNLTGYLNLPEEAKILDLACGKGRHSIYLNSLGYEVTGDKIITKAGIHGKIAELSETTVVVETMAGKIKMEKSKIKNFKISRFR